MDNLKVKFDMTKKGNLSRIVKRGKRYLREEIEGGDMTYVVAV